MEITWNARLRKTAGLCYYKMDQCGRKCRIELSEKVCYTAGTLCYVTITYYIRTRGIIGWGLASAPALGP